MFCIYFRAFPTCPYKCLCIILCCLLAWSCKPKAPSSQEKEESVTEESSYDLGEIEEAGELIAVTISGPDSYYQYHNMDMGLQYMLAEKYANSMGLRIRMEIVQDTTELISMLKDCKADLIAYNLPVSLLKKNGLVGAGMHVYKKDRFWAVRKTSPLLAENLNKWYSPNILSEIKKEMEKIARSPRIRHSTAISPYIPGKYKGSISPYDALFMRHARTIGWDWRLLAAQCFQESAFDPQAISWAGARGLMQIMPGTGAELGVSSAALFHPETNIATATKYIKLLDSKFSDIRNPSERIKFILAAYNGGYNHIRDAMNLARKNRKNPYSWSNVGYYVLHLSEPHFYKDPVVKNGYMIGNETYNYVNMVFSRWQSFRTGVKVRPVMMPAMEIDPTTPSKSHKRNRFSKHPAQILSRNDSIFQIQ